MVSGLSLITISEYSFIDCDRLERFRIPSGVYVGFSGWETPISGGQSLKDIEVDRHHETLYSYEHNLFRDSVLICHPAGLGGRYIVPPFCDCIGSDAFAGCTRMTEVDLSQMKAESRIGMRAFSGCTGLTAIRLPEAVSALGEFVFADCDNLKDIYIENDSLIFAGWGSPFGYLKQTTIHASAGSTTDRSARQFKFKLSLHVAMQKEIQPAAFMNRCEIVDASIEEGTERIGKDAFFGCCNMRTITIPSSVGYIGENAFYGCSRLTMQVREGSYAHDYAIRMGFPCRLIP